MQEQLLALPRIGAAVAALHAFSLLLGAVRTIRKSRASGTPSGRKGEDSLLSLHNLKARARTAVAQTVAASMSVSTVWGSICLFSALLPRAVLPTGRLYLSGFLAGLPIALLLQRGNGNGNNNGAGSGNGSRRRWLALFLARAAALSAWKEFVLGPALAAGAGVKGPGNVGRGWGRGKAVIPLWWARSTTRNLDIMVIAACWAVLGVLVEVRPGAVSAGLRKAVAWVRGDGWVDVGAGASVGERGEEGKEDRKGV